MCEVVAVTDSFPSVCTNLTRCAASSEDCGTHKHWQSVLQCERSVMELETERGRGGRRAAAAAAATADADAAAAEQHSAWAEELNGTQRHICSSQALILL